MDAKEGAPFRCIVVTFGEWVSIMRKRKKLKQKELAAKYMIDISLISKLENDKYDPPPAIRKDLCEFLGDVEIVP